MDQVFGGYGGFYFDPLYNAAQATTCWHDLRDPRSTCFCGRRWLSRWAGRRGRALYSGGRRLFVEPPRKGEAALGSFSGLSDASDERPRRRM